MSIESESTSAPRPVAAAAAVTVMPGLHGTVSVFDGSQEDWVEYAERLESYFIANEITDPAKKRAILINAVGPSTYRLLKTLCLPGKPTDQSFEEIVERVKKHFNPKPSPIVKRFEFNKRKQQPGESVAEFVAAIRKIAEYCEFGTTLNVMLRDRLVHGIADKRVQNRYLRESTLTYEEARDMALAAEAADKDAKRLRDGDDSGSVVQPVVNETIAHVDRRNLPNTRIRSGKGSSRSQPQQQPSDRRASCHRCGGKHDPSKCRYKDYDCHYCKKRGHLASVCRKKARDSKNPNQAHRVDADLPADEEEYPMYTVRNRTTKPLIAEVTLNGVSMKMEVDTGASVSIMAEENFQMLLDKGATLRPTQAKLFTYTGDPIPVVGTTDVEVEHQGQAATLPLIVTRGQGPSLLGRDWLAALKLNWKEMFSVCTNTSLQAVLETFQEVFEEGLGTIHGVSATIHVDPEATPQFYRARPLPYTLKAKVEEELDRLQQQNVIEPVQFSDWAAPIVPVQKSDGSVRICGDYKVTVNKAAKVDQYPIPRIDDLFASLAGGKRFSKLDLSHAYQQVQLEENSRQYVTINTHKGLFRYNRLPFGVSSAPSIFQRIMETLLQGIPGVCVYIDDILVTGRTEEEHLKHLLEVLRRLQAAGMRLKREKCFFLLPSVEYLGHKISEAGLQTADSKVEAIVNAPAPRNVTELRSFLGLVNYYGKFLPNLATLLSPLYALLQKRRQWKWTADQANAFREVKALLQSSRVLVHFDDSLPLILSSDASPYGIGAVLSHRMPNGDEHPVSFASRTLTETEKKYSQLEKEALAIVFGVRKYHQYLYGRKFELRTDHKPLMYIFNEKKSIPMMASGRVQRWALTLGAYSYTIRFLKGSDNSSADAVSRLPLPVTREEPPKPAEVIHLMEVMDASPLTSSQIRVWTEQDPILAKVKNFVLTGWPDNKPNEEQLRPYSNQRRELSIEQGCLLWGSRVVVPEKGRKRVVHMLHQAHPGISRMKSLARCYVWWPGIDGDLELCVKTCGPCQVNQKAPPVVPLHPWSWPSRPWQRVHIDYAGPFMGKMFLLIVDAYTKWLDVHITPVSSSMATIELLRRSFATFGLPEVLVSDNGSNFTSGEFAAFMRANGIKHVKTAPYHPSSNGLVERAVHTLKTGLKKLNEGTLETKLSRFLFAYRTTPHSSTGVSPAELMYNRRIRTVMDNLRPDLGKKVHQDQEQQKANYDRRAQQRQFQVSDLVYAKNYGQGVQWLPGKIVKILGATMFEVQLEDGRKVRKHADQLRSRTSTVSTSPPVESEDLYDARIPRQSNTEPSVNQSDTTPPDSAEQSNFDNSTSNDSNTHDTSDSFDTPHDASEDDTIVEQESNPIELRRSSRVRNPPDRYGQ